MTTRPLASVVTPARPEREQLLVGRCIPSVQALDWPEVEHIIVSDQSPGLADRLAQLPRRPGYVLKLVELNDSWLNELTTRAWGSFPWGFGSRMALGEYVGFLGDDDEYRPNHVRAAVDAMEGAGADFSVSRVAFYAGGEYRLTIGDDTFERGHLDATGVVCRRSAFAVACWTIPPASAPLREAQAGDWRNVREWLAGGLRPVFVDEVTGNHHDGWLK